MPYARVSYGVFREENKSLFRFLVICREAGHPSLAAHPFTPTRSVNGFDVSTKDFTQILPPTLAVALCQPIRIFWQLGSGMSLRYFMAPPSDLHGSGNARDQLGFVRLLLFVKYGAELNVVSIVEPVDMRWVLVEMPRQLP